MRKIGAFVLLGTLCLLSISSCAHSPKTYTQTWYDCFDTFSTLTACTDSQEQFDAYAEICRTLLRDYHCLLDIYHTYDGVNNLKSVNDSAGSAIDIDVRLGDFLAFGKQMYSLTDGHTNIALGRVTTLWQAARTADSPVLPNHDRLLDAMKHTDIECLTLAENRTRVCLSDPDMQLDAGAIGKGYAAQKIAEALLAGGCSSFLLNLGGNVLAYGTKPNGTPWSVGIEVPESSSYSGSTVALQNAALVTSGSYQRYITVDGIRYHHIINPNSGYPDSTYFSVSVQCADSAMADALSTALFCMSTEDGNKLLASLEGVEAFWILADGSVVQTDGWTFRTEESS